MNEIIIKKLGEALALNWETQTIIETESDALSHILGDDLQWIERRNREHAKSIENIASRSGSLEAVLYEARSAELKLDEMRELYLTRGTDWADITKVFEWLGFFEGAALVVWKYLLGVSESTNDRELRKTAVDAVSFHETILLSAGSEETAAGARQGAIIHDSILEAA